MRRTHEVGAAALCALRGRVCGRRGAVAATTTAACALNAHADLRKQRMLRLSIRGAFQAHDAHLHLGDFACLELCHRLDPVAAAVV